MPLNARRNFIQRVIILVLFVLFGVTAARTQQIVNKANDTLSRVRATCQVRQKQIDIFTAEAQGLLDAERTNKTPGIRAVSQARIVAYQQAIDDLNSTRIDCAKVFALRASS